MLPEIINHTRIQGNECFGCGVHNDHGLNSELAIDADQPDRLIGTFAPKEHMVGFPGITHGGAIYTALDCMGAWVPTLLKPDTKAIWILRSANVTYHRPAFQGQPLTLTGRIQQEGGDWEPVTVEVQALNADGGLLVSGEFKVTPLPADKFKKVAGISELPPNWKEFLET
ncbi:MAG: hotdog fold thioesterase [Gammaproteobacteria bacterium]|nr:hotdog fold thioesterase [Gammaproteobacteria bacterium]